MMIPELFFSAVVLGIIVAIPPGSVTVIACQRAIQNGFANSLVFLTGSCLSDIFYIVLVYLGIAGLISENPVMKICLWLVCSFILFFIGISSLLSLKNTGKTDNRTGFLQSDIRATFVSGILVTLANPMTIVGWIAIAGNFFLIWNDKYPVFRELWIPAIFFIMTGVMLWFVPLVFLASRLKKIINQKAEKILIAISDIVLIGFGIIALYNAVSTIVQLAQSS